LPAVNGGQQQQLTPSQKKNPNYYKTIALPIAIDTVEVSLNPTQISEISCGSLGTVVSEWRLPSPLSRTLRLTKILITCRTSLKNLEYSTVSALEMISSGMISNAKSYNSKTSLTFADAERIRKDSLKYYAKINPAYKDRNMSRSHPVPEDVSEKNAEDEDVESQEDQKAEELAAASPWQDSNGTLQMIV